MFDCPPAIAREIDRLRLKCLDDQWLTYAATYRFECQHGHVFGWKAGCLFALGECPECRNVEKLQRLQQRARQDGGLCLDRWLGTSASYRFRCMSDATHEWSRPYHSALRSSRCPHCSRAAEAQRRLTADGLQQLQAYARSRGGQCLSPAFLGLQRKHQFRCAAGHVWEALAGSVLRLKQWCRQCRLAQQRCGIEDVRRAADERGGSFLSSGYRNNRELYEWRCATGHVWKASYGSIRAGTWCPECANDSTRLDLEALNRSAKAMGGTCLSEAYTSTKAYYLWRCAKGHSWSAQYDAIRKGHWCRRCHSDSLRMTIADLQQTALAKGGQCLSIHYENCKKHYLWQCDRGHTWRATYARVRAGTWCPTCYRMSRTKPGSAAWRRYQTHQPRD